MSASVLKSNEPNENSLIFIDSWNSHWESFK